MFFEVLPPQSERGWTVEVVLSGPLLGLGLRSGPDKTTSTVQDGHPYRTFKALSSKS